MRECEHCGAMLDPQEICDCHNSAPEDLHPTLEPTTEIVLRCVTPPVISENVTTVTTYIDDTLAMLAALPRDKEGCATAKALRADLRRQLEAWEDQRKAAKNAVIAPYKAAEKTYNEQIKDPLDKADKQLKDWIDSYQNEIKQNCRDELQSYFDELCAVLHIDFVTFEQTGVVVDMATANLKDPKKARNAIHDFLNRIEDDRRTIATMEDAPEIMAEYRQSLSLSAAIAAVNDRHKRTEQSAQELAQAVQRTAKAEEVRQAVYIEAPEVIQKEEIYSTTFTVTGTLSSLKALKAFLECNHYTYEEVNQ